MSSIDDLWGRYIPAIRVYLTTSAANNTLWMFGGQISLMLLGLAVGIAVVRYLGPDKLGVYQYVISMVAMIAPLGALGLNTIVAREILEDKNSERDILSTAFWLRFMGGLLSTIALVLIVRWLRPENILIQCFVFALAAARLFDAFGVFGEWFHAHVLSKNVVVSQVIASVTGAFLKSAIIIVGSTLSYFVAVSCIEFMLTGLVLLVLYVTHTKRRVSWRFDFLMARLLLKRSLPLIFSAFAVALYLKIDILMLGEFHSNREVGLYAAASRLSEAWYFFPGAVATTALSYLIKNKNNEHDVYMNHLQLLYSWLGSVGILVALMTFLLSPWLIELLYGEQYSESSVILAIHIWACPFIFMRAIFSKWIVIERLTYLSLVTHGLGAIVNIIMNIVLIPSLGGKGAAMATVVAYAVASYVALFVPTVTRESAVMMTRGLFSFPLFIVTLMRKLVFGVKECR